jgi:hypothetical protein
MTVPELRTECKRRGLPCYQSKGKRLRKADLVAQLEGMKGVRKQRRNGPVRTRRNDGLGVVPDRLASAFARAERDLIIDYRAACKHAEARGESVAELRDRDAQTMHRILRGYATPADERHWRTKADIRRRVAGAMA